MGTNYGVNRYDGYNFVTYRHNKQDTTSIVDNEITTFLNDKEGRLWLGSAHGLMRYEAATNSFKRFSFPLNLRPRVMGIIEDAHGNIFVGTSGLGLFLIRRGSDHLESFIGNEVKPKSLFFDLIFQDEQGAIWQGEQSKRIVRWVMKGHRKLSRQEIVSPVGIPVAFFSEGRGRIVVVCTKGLFRYDLNRNLILQPFKSDAILPAGIDIISATRDRKGNILLGTSGNGVFRSQRTIPGFVQLSSPGNKNVNLDHSSVGTIFTDRNDNIWLGCYAKGLFEIDSENRPFQSWSLSEQGYISGNAIESIADDSEGIVWGLAGDDGLYGFDRKGNVVKHLETPKSPECIMRDLQGRMWLATRSMLYGFNPESKSFTSKVGYESNGIHAMASDARGRLFISIYSKGLLVYDPETETTRHFTNNMVTAKNGHICNDWVRSLMCDRKGILWIGTANGLCCLNTANDHFDALGWHKILADQMIESICEEPNGDIVIGTDNGLYIYQRQKRRTIAFPGGDALSSIPIRAIVRDNNNDLWISTLNGIWQYVRGKHRFVAHIQGNGFTYHEYTHCQLHQRASDLIAFGVADGIVAFYPNQVNNLKTRTGNVYLTNFIVNGTMKPCLNNSFSLPYSENSFVMEFSMLNYRNVDNIVYEYRINGGRWQRTREGENAITFTNLQPDKYVIEVRAVYGGTAYSKPAVFTISISHPWYSSTLARLVYALAFIALVYLIIRIIIKRQKDELDEQKMRFLINATHDIRSPLTLIMGPLEKLRRHVTDADDFKDLDTISRNANRLMLLVNEILDVRRLDKNQMVIKCQETAMLEYLQNICSLFQFNATSRHINLHIQCDQPDTKAWIDRINFDKVVTNLLSNAFKYSADGGEIVLRLSHDETTMTLQVVDTGSGLGNQDPAHLFSRFYQGDNAWHNHHSGTGIGLNLCKSIVEMHGGTISARNRNDGQQGSVFEVKLPLGRAHLKDEQVATVMPVKTAATKSMNNKGEHVLVVDDDPEIGRYIASELGSWYYIDTAPNGDVALGMIMQGDYDLVISDVVMPVMDGTELLKRIKSNPNIFDTPVIMLTSKNEIEDRLQGYKLGADAYLPKPFNMEELHILIDNQIDAVRRIKGKYSWAVDQQDNVKNIEVESNNDALMDRIMKSINNHLEDPDFSVEQLCEEVGISRAHLHRKMKEMTGIATREFIRNLRLEQAARIISKGGVNINQVAYSVGFNNSSHFTTVFKKYYGMTPTQYGEKHSEGIK